MAFRMKNLKPYMILSSRREKSFIEQNDYGQKYFKAVLIRWGWRIEVTMDKLLHFTEPKVFYL